MRRFHRPAAAAARATVREEAPPRSRVAGGGSVPARAQGRREEAYSLYAARPEDRARYFSSTLVRADVATNGSDETPPPRRALIARLRTARGLCRHDPTSTERSRRARSVA